jgi:hypothetical protein
MKAGCFQVWIPTGIVAVHANPGVDPKGIHQGGVYGGKNWGVIARFQE